MSIATSSVKQAYEPAFEEIARRSQAASLSKSECGGRVVEVTELPKLENQNWVLISLGTNVLAPKPVDEAHPALRVYGAFATREDAADHASVVSEIDASCSLIRIRTRKWMMMPQTKEALQNPLAHEARMQERLEAHRQRRREEQARFDEAVRTHAEHQQREVSAAQWSEEDEETQEAENEIYKRPKALRVGAEVRHQGAVVLSVIRDKQGGECLFCIVGCHETAADAHAWVLKITAEQTVDTDLLVAHTCDWLFPNGTDATKDEHYRNAELQKIMDAARKNTENVQRFKDWENSQATDAGALTKKENDDDEAGTSAVDD